ncbi:hypothetical protein MMAG44476_03962 [Mycolicibacterium mageritense DSM 44476 = CIP 104973]|uniref:Uncharacterized protein n=1 Tax=Mycolicibacterium mageritense TaxID=53462 RepID=A0ABM7I001_MYCME|nr:hypothetical protein [Mycolicibacterium mageritense]BBX36198.1 hypothetical protein MMAGJ_54800 [Mycolicibacterium mageritense]CDO24310.1 hypothetical protein BN978_04806 [Mycolicibacterium mageritense DSM 44476 = CIP 104973]
MKYARRLRQEVDLWSAMWQQVETFVDRISGAADSDATARRQVQALLTVAAVIERARQPTETRSLGAPVVAGLPTAKVDRSGTSEPVADPWSPADRTARLPGLDDLELAAGPVSTVNVANEPIDGDLTMVRLMAARAVPVRVDPRAGVVTLGAMPSYSPQSGTAAATIVGPTDRLVDIQGADGELAGLFSVTRRVLATMGTEPDTEHVRSWGELAAARRAAVTDATKISLDPPSAAGRAALLAAQATALVESLRAATIPAAAAAGALAALIATRAAQGNLGAGADADADALADAAEILDDEGTDDAALPDDVNALAAALRGTPAAQQALVAAITALAAAPTSTARQDAVLTRARALGLTASASRLLSVPVEAGPLRAELDKAVAGRLQYPDGSLRMLRTMEAAFAWTWPQRVRWFTTRRDLVLAPLLARFRAPFHTSLRALIDGGDTGLLALGLTVGPTVAVSATQVVTGEPDSLLPTVDDIEPGQVGVIGGDRAAAVTILGVGAAHGRVTLDVVPVRVSVAAGAGLAGLIPGGSDIEASAAGLTPDELRTGESAQGPAADGLVAETLALWSRLCAVFGRATVEAESAPVPDPAGGPLQHVPWLGTVPARATTLVLTDLPAAMWDRTDPEDPVPRAVRAGETLLLRGTAQPEGGGPATVVQGVVEVDTVVRTTGSMLDAMDLAAAGRLSTVAPSGDDTPPFRCGPEADVAVVTLRRNTVDVALTGPVTLRRDFTGFDAMSLATGRMLPPELFGAAPSGPAGVDRSREFSYANEVFTDWLRYARQ